MTEYERVKEQCETYEKALTAIAALWPEPPHCAPIVAKWIGPNDGKMRAINLQAAINIARKALGKPQDKSGE